MIWFSEKRSDSLFAGRKGSKQKRLTVFSHPSGGNHFIRRILVLPIITSSIPENENCNQKHGEIKVILTCKNTIISLFRRGNCTPARFRKAMVFFYFRYFFQAGAICMDQQDCFCVFSTSYKMSRIIKIISVYDPAWGKAEYNDI